MAKSRQQKRQEMRKGTAKTDNSMWVYGIITLILAVFIGVFAYFTANSQNNQTPTQTAIEYHKEPQVTGEHEQVVFITA